jgi:Peptidase inhibitor family I36
VRAPNVNPWAVAVIIGLLIAAVVVVVIWVGIFNGDADASTLDTSCPNGHVCAWGGTNYTTGKVTYDASAANSGTIPVGFRLSVKNKFDNRAVHLTRSGFFKCLRPGGFDPAIAFTAINIRPRGTNCGAGS